MTHLTHNDITTLFLALGLMLAAARLLGEVAAWLRQPSVLGELLAGILLGPTVFGTLFPDAQQALFPSTGTFPIVLEGITTLAIALFLLVAGMEVDLSTVWRQGRTALTVGIVGMVVPFALGLGAGFVAPHYLGAGEGVTTWAFALFFATALSISALPVIAKILIDLNLFRTDLGMIIIASAILNDLLGWLIFAGIIGMIGGHAPQSMPLGMTIALALGFAAAMLTVGKSILNRILPWIQAHTTWPAGVLGFALAAALLCAAFTEWIGIHAIFGAFLFGVALGDSHHLRERTRAAIEQFVSFIFAPLFFVGIGLRVNFAQNFDLGLVIIVIVIATVGKILGCRLGGKWSGLAPRESWAVGFGMNARGAMEIILGLLGLNAGVISERMFVALVVMAIFTSMTSGMAIQSILHMTKPVRFIDYLSAAGFVGPLRAHDAKHAIRELANALASAGPLANNPKPPPVPGNLSASLAAGLANVSTTTVDAETIYAAAWERERIMPTSLGNGVAIPHARLDGLKAPIVAVGFSAGGIDFDARDGLPARLIFLVLTPTDDNRTQLQILADIGRLFKTEQNVTRALAVEGITEFRAMVRTGEVRPADH